MSPYEFVSHFVSISGLFIMITLVALKNFRSRLNRSFIIFALILAVYLILNFIEGIHTAYGTQLILTRAALFEANFVPASFYYFTLCFMGISRSRKWYDYTIYLTPLVLAPLAFAGANIARVEYTNYGVVIAKAGPLLWLTLISFFFTFGITFWLLYKHYKKSTQTVRSQIKLVVYSTFAVVMINMITQIALPEFHINSLGNIIGNPSIVIFVICVGYSILRQQLFDIRYTIIRSFAFVSTMFLVLVSFAFLLLVPFRALFPSLHLPLSEKIYFITVVLLLAFGFRPLTRFFQKVTDKIFYQDLYSSEEVVKEIGGILASEIQLDNLSQNVRQVLAQRLKINQVDIVVLQNGEIFYEAGNYFPHIHQKLARDLQALGSELLLDDELLEGDKKTLLRRYGISLFKVLETGGEKVGYLIFSEKLNGTSYNPTDVKVVEIVADELAIAIQNSRSYSIIQKFNTQLQQRIDEATVKLKGANEELKHQDEVKNEFISMISHQLGNPLAVIDGFLTNTVEGFYGQLDSNLNDVLSKALARTRMMKALVSDLLNISRMDAGKFFLELSETDMTKIVLEEIEALTGEAGERKVKLTFHKPTTVIPRLNIDEPKTRQAVMNLITNALRYAAGGHVDVYLEADSRYVVFRVVDDGIGVPEEVKKNLFNKFFRAQNARERVPDGTGIGLYLVKRVINDQNGELIFESQLNKGSTFGFRLPVDTSSAPTSSRPAQPAIAAKPEPAREPAKV